MPLSISGYILLIAAIALIAATFLRTAIPAHRTEPPLTERLRTAGNGR